MANWGAFAGGLSSGIVTGSQLARSKKLTDLAESRDQRDAERFGMEKDDANRKTQAWQDLGNLVDEYVNPQPAAPELSQVRNGVMPATDPAATGVKIRETDENFGPPATSAINVPARLGVMPAQARAAEVSPLDAAVAKLSPEEAQQFKERVGERMTQERIGMGLWRNPNLFKDPQFANRAAQIFLRSGMPEGVKWLERGAQAVEEHGIDALKRLIAGDTRGAEEAFNAGGKMRVVPGSTSEAGNGRWQITLESGEQHVIDPRQQLRSYLKPKEFFDLALNENKAKSEAQARTDTAAHRERLIGETERHNRETEKTQARNADVKLELARIRSERGANAATALERNVDFLVKNKIAKDSLDAFNKLRTAMEKPEEDAVLSVASALMRGPGYAGRDGWTRATRDATSMVRSVKGPKQPGNDPAPGPGSSAPGAKPASGSYTVKGKTFSDTDINATAQKYGMTPEQVKAQLGIR